MYYIRLRFVDLTPGDEQTTDRCNWWCYCNSPLFNMSLMICIGCQI